MSHVGDAYTGARYFQLPGALKVERRFGSSDIRPIAVDGCHDVSGAYQILILSFRHLTNHQLPLQEPRWSLRNRDRWGKCQVVKLWTTVHSVEGSQGALAVSVLNDHSGVNPYVGKPSN